jgi:enolase-phosphatase E1
MITIAGLQHVLLDIEGTTCPVSFVGEVLFPYAKQQMPVFLADQAENPIVKGLIDQVFDAWDKDSDLEAASLRQRYANNDSEAAVSYLWWLIEKDRKLTALKELQGLIWRRGYEQGLLKAPLYPDVPEALGRWKNAGLELSIYSSGSINAQKLLYQYSNYGDLSHLFCQWFDTNIGDKQIKQSYSKIAETLNTNPEQIVFISDRKSELCAAEEAGFKVLFSRREGNPETDNGIYLGITNYAKLSLYAIPN